MQFGFENYARKSGALLARFFTADSLRVSAALQPEFARAGRTNLCDERKRR
jgi:hypothetical protein